MGCGGAGHERVARVRPSGAWGGGGDDGGLAVSGRSEDMIIHGSADMWPRELVEILVRHPDFAIVDVHDDHYGKNTCACVIPRPGTTATTAHHEIGVGGVCGR